MSVRDLGAVLKRFFDLRADEYRFMEYRNHAQIILEKPSGTMIREVCMLSDFAILYTPI